MTIYSRSHKRETRMSLSHILSKRIAEAVRVLIMLLAVILGVALPAEAKPADAYRKSSVLSSGKWVKISVAETGMQTLSYARLRSMGFTDPSKVNVYGYGGRMISDALDDNQIDDLPMLPVVRTPEAIIFYGVGNLTQNKVAKSGYYNHLQHAYSDDSFYFLSDRPVDEEDMLSEARPAKQGCPSVSTFTRLLVHEQDQQLASYMTRAMVGEDFRTQTMRQFPFDLKGRASSGKVRVNVSFISKTSSRSTLLLETDASALTKNVDLSAVAGEKLFNHASGTLDIDVPKQDKLNVKLTFRGSGVITSANLDYIEVFYPCRLALDDTFLHFNIEGNSLSGSNVQLEGLSANSVLWDVTNPGHPVNIPLNIEAGKAEFYSDKGMREYVVFNPVATSLQPVAAGSVANQDLHSLPVPDMLVVTPREYMSAAERFADLHRNADGMTVHVLTPEEIYMEFSSGVRDLGAIRKLMKMWYDRGAEDGHELKYCLLMGRTSNDCKSLKATADGVTYPIMLSWQNPPAFTDGCAETSAYTTDDYIGMLDDSTPTTFSMENEKIRVAVGRFPVKTLSEANAAVDKLEGYMTRPDYGSWRNRLLIIADNGDNNDHLNQAEAMYNGARQTEDGKNLKVERLYLDSYKVKYTASGKEYTDARTKLYDLLDQGVMYIDYLGHGNTRSWTHERLMLWEDLTGLRNKHLPVILTGTCEFGRWDDTSVSAAENMWLNTSGGAVALLSTTRKVWVSENGEISKAIGQAQFKRNEKGESKRLGEFFTEAKNNVGRSSTQRLRYNIIGDPALKMPVHLNRVDIESIEGAEEDKNGYPVVKARSKFTAKGCVKDSDGSELSDFNGYLEFTLMDAEVVVETFGEPNTTDNSSPTRYNDRKTVLYTGMCVVKDGKFEFTVPMPSEIDNNYSPAQLSLYAYSDAGLEANGSFEKFYVYGYYTDADEDTEGPAIERFVLNGDNFADGDVTHDTPVVYATLSDASGINLSQSGIGHKLTLVLDEKTIYDNLSSAFSIDATDYTRGTLAYVLPSLEPGEHTLRLTAWDNANNSSSATLSFKVAVNRAPALYDVTALTDKTSASVTFILSHDRPQAAINSMVEVFDLNGRKLWSGTSNAISDLGSDVRISWDLTDKSGERVPRGIYIYRATIETSEGTRATKSKKMAVGAPK